MIASRRRAHTPSPAAGGNARPTRWPAPQQVARRIAQGLHATAFWRAAAVVVCVVAAYNYSLQTLVQEMGQQTPFSSVPA
jgi:hypothetical protein